MFKLPFYFQLAAIALNAIRPIVEATPWVVDNLIHEALYQIVTTPETAGSIENLVKEEPAHT